MIEVSDITDIKDCENTVICGDCIEAMKLFPDNFLDSCVTDPPYGLEFMGKEWDKFKSTGSSKHILGKENIGVQGSYGKEKGFKAHPRFNSDMLVYQDWCYTWALELFRIMKPGAYLLAFGGTRTYHRLACAIEDAGFEIHDQIDWVYGSGFPKGTNISKAIDKRLGNEQPIVGHKGSRLSCSGDYERIGKIPFATDKKDGSMSNPEQMGAITQPVSEDAMKWQGWNTALKPAHEPIVLAQKPRERTYVDNVLTYGVGALNIDGCRIVVSPDSDNIGKTTERDRRQTDTWEEGSGFKNEQNPMAGVLPSGRYPANLILSHHPACRIFRDGQTRIVGKSRLEEQNMGKYGIYNDGSRNHIEFDYSKSVPEIWECIEGCPVKVLNEQSGDSKSSPVGFKGVAWKHSGNTKDEMTPLEWQRTFNDSGGASRFFKTFDGEWLCHPDCPMRILNEQSGSNTGCKAHHIKSDPNATYEGWGTITNKDEIVGYPDSGGAARFFYCAKPSVRERNAGLNGVRNMHITVKPVSLMRYLIRLITPENGVVFDPFLGSGTTAIAAENECVRWFGCDISKEYCEIAEKRISALGGCEDDEFVQQTLTE